MGYDVAVVGAGPAGAATARRLASAGHRVVLLERSRFERPRVGESLAPGVDPLLRDLGVWSSFTALHPLPVYGTRSVWGSARPESHSHMVSPYGCGWNVDRARFDRMLAESAADAGAELRCGAAVVRADRTDHWRLEVTGSAEPVRARVLVEATGRSASLARQLGAGRTVADRLVGVAAEVRTGAAGGYVLIETTRDGWWYSAPVAGDRVACVLMTDGDICRRRSAYAAGPFRELLSRAPVTAARLADPADGRPRVHSSVSQRLRRSPGDAPWLAVGDAALAVDPISGSGVVRALRTAKHAAGTVATMLDGRTREAVAAYESARDREWTEYRREHALYYGAEQRWADAPFWQRRTGG